jgi:hypothetical protein
MRRTTPLKTAAAGVAKCMQLRPGRLKVRRNLGRPRGVHIIRTVALPGSISCSPPRRWSSCATMLGSVAKQRAELRLMGQGAGRIGLCILGICGPNASLASKPVWKFPCTVVRVRRMAQCSFARSRALHTSHACCMQVYAVHDMPIRVGRCCTLLHNAVIVCTPRVLDAGTSVVSFPRQAAEAPARGSHRSRHAASWGPDLKPRHGLGLLSSATGSDSRRDIMIANLKVPFAGRFMGRLSN